MQPAIVALLAGIDYLYIGKLQYLYFSAGLDLHYKIKHVVCRNGIFTVRAAAIILITSDKPDR